MCCLSFYNAHNIGLYSTNTEHPKFVWSKVMVV